MLFLICCAILGFAIICIISIIQLKEIIFPICLSFLGGLLGLVAGFLILLISVSCWANEVFDTQTFDIVPLNTNTQIVYYVKDNSDYTVFTNEENELIEHKANYEDLHFLKENEKAYAIKERVGLKNHFWNTLFEFPKHPYYKYSFYIPVT